MFIRLTRHAHQPQQRASFSLFSQVHTPVTPPPTIKFCPQCKINASEGGSVCKTCLAAGRRALTPAKITEMLSNYVVGQDQVKRALGVSMFLHLQRVKANDWIKYEGKPNKQRQDVITVADPTALLEVANIAAGIHDFINDVMRTFASADGKLVMSPGQKWDWKAMTDLKSCWDEIESYLITANVSGTGQKPSVMNELAVLASKAPTEEQRLALLDECKAKLERGKHDLLLDILEEEVAYNDWTRVPGDVLAQRLDLIRAFDRIDSALALQLRVTLLARPVMRAKEALVDYKEFVLGSKAALFLPLDEQRIVVQERHIDGKTQNTVARDLIPLKFRLSTNCERALAVCTESDEELVRVLTAVHRCLDVCLQIDAPVAEAEVEADATPADTEAEAKAKQQQEEEANEHAAYDGRIQDVRKLQVAKFEKSNVLLMGPTGSGKTLLCKSLAECVQVPLVICDATSLTAAGYVGDDVDSVLYKLLEEANWDVSRAESGIVFLDEIDKIAKRGGSGRTKDISGEAVQFGLLKILEGTKVQITKKPKNGGGSGGSMFQNERTSNVTIDTSNILFVCSGAFTGMDTIVARRTQSRSLGFSNAVQKSYDSDTAGLSQRDELFAKVEPVDLIEFGMIPEFVGRFSTITSTKFLTEEDLVRVLVEPTNSVVNQMRALFRLGFDRPVELIFTPGALHAIAQRAIKMTSGARGLRVIVEQLTRQSLFTLAEQADVTHVIVDEQAVESKGKTCLHLTQEQFAEWDAKQQQEVVAPVAEAAAAACVAGG